MHTLTLFYAKCINLVFNNQNIASLHCVLQNMSIHQTFRKQIQKGVIKINIYVKQLLDTMVFAPFAQTAICQSSTLSDHEDNGHGTGLMDTGKTDRHY